MSSTLTVWYNTKCPVCNAGIEWRPWPNGEHIRLEIDVTNSITPPGCTRRRGATRCLLTDGHYVYQTVSVNSFPTLSARPQ